MNPAAERAERMADGRRPSRQPGGTGALGGHAVGADVPAANDGFNAHFDIVTIIPLTKRAGWGRAGLSEGGPPP